MKYSENEKCFLYDILLSHKVDPDVIEFIVGYHDVWKDIISSVRSLESACAKEVMNHFNDKAHKKHKLSLSETQNALDTMVIVGALTVLYDCKSQATYSENKGFLK